MGERDKEDRDGILALLKDVADHDQTPEEATDDLVKEGVNVTAFLASVHQAVERRKKEERLAPLHREAQKNREAFAQTSADIDVSAMDRAQLEAAARPIIEENHWKKLEEHTDDDLRTLLLDRARLEKLAK